MRHRLFSHSFCYWSHILCVCTLSMVVCLCHLVLHIHKWPATHNNLFFSARLHIYLKLGINYRTYSTPCIDTDCHRYVYLDEPKKVVNVSNMYTWIKHKECQFFSMPFIDTNCHRNVYLDEPKPEWWVSQVCIPGSTKKRDLSVMDSWLNLVSQVCLPAAYQPRQKWCVAQVWLPESTRKGGSSVIDDWLHLIIQV